jgi:hypothetical protein
MLRHAIIGAIAIAALIVSLFLIDTASLHMLPPCPIEQVVHGNQKSDAKHDDKFCAAPKGVISAGLQEIGDLLSPDSWTALATVVMAVFTGLLSLVAYQQIVLSRSEFLATNRPLLRVRYFKRTDGEKDTEIDIRFSVVNVGKSVAHLLGSSIQIGWFYENGLPTPFYLGGPDVTGQRKFEVGASDEYIFRRAKPEQKIFVPLHVYGYLVYADSMGNTRTTAFCRRWIVSAQRFVKVEDPDYEYED